MKSLDRARGRRKRIRRLLEELAAWGQNIAGQRVDVNHARAPDEAAKLAGVLRRGHGADEAVIGEISPTVGAHVGSGTLSIFFPGAPGRPQAGASFAPRGCAMSHVLVVEDDTTLAGMLRLYLEKEGYQVTVTADGAAGLAAARTVRPDLMILDVMLPRMDGWEVCRQVRELSRIPIILLTALDREQHKVQGLDLGADDYVTKPFSMRELMARVRARLRHPPAGETADSMPLEFPGLRIDPGARVVTVAGQVVDLTPKEFDLLLHLARAAGRVLTRGDLVQRVWQYPMGSDDRTLHTHMLRLRRKLGAGGREYLHTVWGVGYKFEVSP